MCDCDKCSIQNELDDIEMALYELQHEKDNKFEEIKEMMINVYKDLPQDKKSELRDFLFNTFDVIV